MENIINDEYILSRGYKNYAPTRFDSDSVVTRFQKRFDDDRGKKYFINVIKHSHDFIPVERRDAYWTPYGYEYEVQVNQNDNYIDIHFHSDWTLEGVEKFMEDFFNKMSLDYYETWDN